MLASRALVRKAVAGSPPSAARACCGPAAATEALTIRVNATITINPYGMEIPVRSNKTIIGVGRNGVIRNGGFNLGVGTSNVIIRNLTIGDTKVASDDPDDKDFDYDGIQMDTANRVWIDHNWIHDTNDGLIDSRMDTPTSATPVPTTPPSHLHNNYMQNIRSYGNLSAGWPLRPVASLGAEQGPAGWPLRPVASLGAEQGPARR